MLDHLALHINELFAVSFLLQWDVDFAGGFDSHTFGNCDGVCSRRRAL